MGLSSEKNGPVLSTYFANAFTVNCRAKALALVLLTAGCTTQGDLSQLPEPAPGYPLANGPGEKMQKGEDRAAQAIGNAIETGLTRRAEARMKADDGTLAKLRPFVRDAHPKAHGCVRANFKVVKNLPAQLKHGVLKEREHYCAWVRFSNSNEDPDRSDVEKDGRGMAIKLMGVPGKTLLDAHKNAGTQDFIMISNPVFFINDALDYAKLVERQNEEGGRVVVRPAFRHRVAGGQHRLRYCRPKQPDSI